MPVFHFYLNGKRVTTAGVGFRLKGSQWSQIGPGKERVNLICGLAILAVAWLVAGRAPEQPKMNAVTNVSIAFVSPSDLEREVRAVAARGASRAGRYETWKGYHDSLCKVARQHGTVSDSPDPAPDFYFSGDWFHERSDAFALLTTRGLSSRALRDFQSVVAAHHSNARLSMGGDVTTPLRGLDILITASGIYVAWDGQTPDGCKAKLAAMGVGLE